MITNELQQKKGIHLPSTFSYYICYKFNSYWHVWQNDVQWYKSRYLQNTSMATKFVITCSCIISISIEDNIFDAPFPLNISLTFASFLLASQIQRLVCGYNARYLVVNLKASSYMYFDAMHPSSLALFFTFFLARANIVQWSNTIYFPLVHKSLIHPWDE